MGDNLANTRVTFDTKSGSATLLKQDDYYPFGLEINTLTNSPKNEYLHNKKELQEETQQYDYGARFYDPVIARWNTIDPLAEKYKSHTPYHYGLDNPIRNIDMNGDSIRTIESQSATNSMQQVAEEGMGNTVAMRQNNEGVWDMSELSTYDAEGMTLQQMTMYNTMHDLISGPAVADFSLVDHNDAISQQILIGDNGAAPAGYTVTTGLHTIDMGDKQNMGSTGALTGKGALVHELSEGMEIQTKGVSGTDAHFDTAIPTESAVDGVQINLNRQNGPTVTSNGNTSTVSIPVTVNGVKRMVTINFVNGNIPATGGMQNNQLPQQ